MTLPKIRADRAQTCRPAAGIALSFDIEEFFHSANFDGVLTPQDWDHLPSRVEQYTHQILELLDLANRHATFFVLGWVAERHAGLVVEIARHGHEIACHGYGHRLIYQQHPTEFREDVRRAKGILEEICGQAVVGYRAPTFSIVRDSLWALNVLTEEGYLYDSSVFPVRHDRYGIPGAWRFPFRTPNGLIEFPLSTWTGLGFCMPIAGGGYFRLMPYGVVRLAYKAFQRAAQPSIFYLHPWDIDPQQPVGLLNPLLRQRQTRGAAATAQKLWNFLNEFPCAPVRTVLDSLPLEVRPLVS